MRTFLILTCSAVLILSAAGAAQAADACSPPAGAACFFLSNGPDMFGGTSGTDCVNGLAGNDQMSGAGGDDYLTGRGESRPDRR